MVATMIIAPGDCAAANSCCAARDRALIGVGTVLFLCCMAGPATAATQSVVGSIEKGYLRIEVDNYNPLYWAIDELSRLCKCAIAFEDVPWSNPDDLTPANHRAGQPTTRQVKRESLSVSRAVDGPLTNDLVTAVLHEILSAYERKGFSGRFAVVDDGILQVVPMSMKDTEGRVEAIAPLLDTVISLPADRATPAQWLSTVGAALSEASGVPVVVVLAANSSLLGRGVQMSATSEPARAVLARLFAQLPVRAAWRLTYNPERREYVMGLQSAPLRR